MLSAVVCAAIYMIVSPQPGIKRAESPPPSRTLAYQDKIVRADDAPSEEVNDYVEVLIDAVLNGFSIHAEKSPKSGEASPSSSNPELSN